MKNLKNAIVALLFAIILPIGLILTGCGATPSDSVQGVHFVSNIYDETTGMAIFEVDFNVDTELTYKLNPSTASAYAEYSIPKEGEVNSDINRSRFEFEAGIIRVTDRAFEPVEIKLTVSGFSDQCIVRLKEYPNSMKLKETNIILNSGSSYAICPIGIFGTGNAAEERIINDVDYKFEVSSSNETYVSVPNKERLKICAEKQNGNGMQVDVTVKMFDNTGNQIGIGVIKVTVTNAVESGFLSLDGVDKFVYDGDTLVINAADLETYDGAYVLGYTAYFMSDKKTFFDSYDNYYFTSDSTDYIKDDVQNNKLLLYVDFDFEFEATLWSSLTDKDGNLCKIQFKVKLDV